MTARLKEEPKFLPSVYIDRILGKNEQEFRDSIIKTALSYLGTSYRWGGKTTLGIDCSGLCQMAYLLMIDCRNRITVHVYNFQFWSPFLFFT